MRNLDKKALRRSIWSSFSRVIGIGLSAGAGSMIHKLVGNNLEGWGLASAMAICSFAFMAFAEYEREKG
jgi:O-antigen/teichoic acid export membrane protein